MLREAHAIWKDGPYTGGGAISTPSGVLNNCKYNFGSLTGLTACTSPAEMLAAAIASSMSRMVAVEMAKAGIRPLQVETDAALTVDFVGEVLRIVGAQLNITARTGDSEFGRFEEAVDHWKKTAERAPIDSYRGLADYYMLKEDFEQADRAVKELERIAPSSDLALLCRGWLSAVTGDRPMAMKMIEKLQEYFQWLPLKSWATLSIFT